MSSSRTWHRNRPSHLKTKSMVITFIHIECIIGLWMDKLYGLVSRSNCGWQIVNETANLLKLTVGILSAWMLKKNGKWNKFGVLFFLVFISHFFYPLFSLHQAYEQTQGKSEKERKWRVHTNRKIQCRNKQENKLILAIIPFQWKLCKLISELEMKKQFFFLAYCKVGRSITSHQNRLSHLPHFYVYILRILDIEAWTRNEGKHSTWCGNIAKRTEMETTTTTATVDVQKKMVKETNRKIVAVVTTVVALFKSFVCYAYITHTPSEQERKRMSDILFSLKCS